MMYTESRELKPTAPSFQSSRLKPAGVFGSGLKYSYYDSFIISKKSSKLYAPSKEFLSKTMKYLNRSLSALLAQAWPSFKLTRRYNGDIG
ncbi:MAG: hypothetical protein ACM3YE_02440 [Bacteroidota bacterium]